MATLIDDEAADALHVRPCTELVEFMPELRDGLMVLGAGGKMGPTLCMLARAAADRAGVPLRVTAVSRFTEGTARARLDAAGVETMSADLLDPSALASLPDIPNIIFMAGRKFGSSGNPALTWALNVTLPALVARRFARARLVALSTGNVYPLTITALRGAAESLAPAPVGEYAWTCLGRERVITQECGRAGIPAAIIRLNYAVDVRYGVLVDIAQRVRAGIPIDLTTGHVNVIWQGDANAAILLAFRHAAAPPFVLNVTGRETWSVRHLATCFGDLFGIEPRFTGTEAPTALLSDASLFHELMPFPRTGIDAMIREITRWMEAGGEVWNKPTQYDVRDGVF